jgi:hypothetical protein
MNQHKPCGGADCKYPCCKHCGAHDVYRYGHKNGCAFLTGDTKEQGENMDTKEAVKHTPGPWHTLAVDWKGQGYQLRPASMSTEVIGYIGKGTRMEANARLIAAAPDLLAFVQMLVDGAENDKPEPADLLTQAKALILRATGEK